MRAKLVTVGMLVAVAAGAVVPAPVVAAGKAAVEDPASQVSAAVAATGTTPLDCPGVVATRVGYRLTQDTACTLEWVDVDTVFDLGGHTFTGSLLPGGERQTVRNGTLVATFDYWANASDFRVSHVTVQPETPGACDSFCIEAGDVTIEHSTFRDYGGIALDFFFGSDGSTIRHTDFVRNHIGVSIQGDSGLVLEKNRFIDNDIGLNLFTEDGFGVNDLTIRTNMFRQNDLGLRMHADDPPSPFSNRILSGNRVTANLFDRNRGSGIVIQVDCYPDQGDPCDLPADNYLDQNHFWRNGRQPVAPDLLADDGITARGTDRHDESDPTDHPELLAGFRLARNYAHHNGDLGFDVTGVADGNGHRSWANGNPAQCAGVVCKPAPPAPPATRVAPAGAVAPAAAAPLEQLQHQ
jgi:hypothetical protein